MKTLKKTKLALAAISLMAATTAMAENIAITGATAHTMGKSGVVENATVLIADGKIKSVKADGSVPSGYRAIDASGKWVTPGIVGAYTSLGLVDVEYSAGIADYSASLEDPDSLGTQIQTKYAVNPDSSLMNIMRIEGITSAASVMSGTDTLFQGQGAFITLGSKTNPLVKADAMMTLDLTGGSIDGMGGSRAVVWPKFMTALAEAASLKGNEIDLDEDWEGTFEKGDMNALIPVMAGEIPLLITVNRAMDIRHITHVKQKYPKLDIVLVHATEAWMVADDLARLAIPVILQPESNLPYDFDELGATLTNAAKLDAAGVKVAIGMDTHNARLVMQHAGNAVAHGLPWEKGLASITSVAAEVLGVDATHGSLDKGKTADVVVWSGDPLEVMSYAETVIINGEQVPMTSRQSKLRDRYLSLDSAKPYRYIKP